MCVDPNESWLALGTSSGFHICWDLRFQLPISTFSHQTSKCYLLSWKSGMLLHTVKRTSCMAFQHVIVTDARVRRLACHPTEPSWLISAVQGHNEISMWNMETQCRQAMLWASSAQPFSSNSQDNQQKVLSNFLLAFCVLHVRQFILCDLSNSSLQIVSVPCLRAL